MLCRCKNITTIYYEIKETQVHILLAEYRDAYS